MERTTTGNGRARHDGAALGGVARDVIDHVTIIVRDSLKIGWLEGRRYVDHLRRDVARQAAWRAAAAIAAAVAALCALLAAFLGIASAIGVAWTFAIYAGLFAVGAIVAASLAARPAARDEAEEIARRFPAARARQGFPEHLLIEQQSSPEGHRREVEEAWREAGPQEAERQRSLRGPGVSGASAPDRQRVVQVVVSPSGKSAEVISQRSR
jgi:hypothetical protein